jgi:hypothetical protein
MAATKETEHGRFGFLVVVIFSQRSMEADAHNPLSGCGRWNWKFYRNVCTLEGNGWWRSSPHAVLVWRGCREITLQPNMRPKRNPPTPSHNIKFAPPIPSPLTVALETFPNQTPNTVKRFEVCAQGEISETPTLTLTLKSRGHTHCVRLSINPARLRDSSWCNYVS